MLKVLVLMMLAAVATAGLLAGLHTVDAQQSATATRSFSASSVATGDEVTVTIALANYGGIGRLTETFPDGYTFVSSTAGATQAGRTLTFNLVADTSVSYVLMATAMAGSGSFSGTLTTATGDSVSVGGDSMLTASAPPTPTPTPTPSATRSFSPSSVEPGGEVTVTIAVANYGGIGRVTETFPGDFTFVSSMPPLMSPSHTLTFNLVADTSVSYTLTAPSTPGTHSFSGTLSPATGDDVTVGGQSRLSVRPPTPANSPPRFSEGSSASRSVDENSAAGTAVGDPITATDRDSRDRGRLRYSLSGADASLFDIDSSDGQISVGAGTMLDYEATSTYSVTAQVRDRANRSDSIDVTIMVNNVNEDGAVALSPAQPKVGMALTASLTDPDGMVSAVAWTWSRSDADTMTWTVVATTSAATSTSNAYTPVEADRGNFLQATAMYEDGAGMGQTASAASANMVPISAYDTNFDGRIDRDEVIEAIRDYLFNGILNKDQVIAVIRLYLFP